MKSSVFSFTLTVVLLSFLSCKEGVTSKPKTDGVQWLTIDQALKAENPENKRYIVQIETDSCKWCDIMHENTYSNKSLSDFINQNFIPVKFNCLYMDTLEFKGKKYGPKKIGRLQIHELADLWLVYLYTYPTTIIMDPEFNQLIKFTGAKDPDQFLLELKKM